MQLGNICSSRSINLMHNAHSIFCKTAINMLAEIFLTFWLVNELYRQKTLFHPSRFNFCRIFSVERPRAWFTKLKWKHFQNCVKSQNKDRDNIFRVKGTLIPPFMTVPALGDFLPFCCVKIVHYFKSTKANNYLSWVKVGKSFAPGKIGERNVGWQDKRVVGVSYRKLKWLSCIRIKMVWSGWARIGVYAFNFMG